MFVKRLTMMIACYFVTLAIWAITWFATPLPWWKSPMENGNARSVPPLYKVLRRQLFLLHHQRR